jgi:general secretion pathway protein I
MKNSHHSPSRGFTLVEVLAAMALIALAALAMMKAISESARATGLVRERVLAEIVAENRLIETLSAPPARELGASSGRVTMAGQDWRWTQTSAPTSDAAVVRVEVVVTAEDKGPELAALTAFRGAP